MTYDDLVVEQAVLVARTAALSRRTRELADLPYDQSEHDVLNDHLAQHRLTLADFRRRCHEAGF
jgi:hypothetical protein